jgi:hypothetical protein
MANLRAELATRDTHAGQGTQSEPKKCCIRGDASFASGGGIKEGLK